MGGWVGGLWSDLGLEVGWSVFLPPGGDFGHSGEDEGKTNDLGYFIEDDGLGRWVGGWVGGWVG